MNEDAIKEFYDQIAELYDSRYGDLYSLLYDEVTWQNLSMFLPASNESLILDAGGGTGYCSIPLALQGYRVVHIDISKGMLLEAERKLSEANVLSSVDLVQGNICDLSIYEDQSFDFVLCQGSVLSCCDGFGAALRELARVAKEGSYVNISVHHRFGWVPFLLDNGRFCDLPRLMETGELVWQEGVYRKHTLQTFTVDQVHHEFRKCGLQPKRLIGKLVLYHSLLTKVIDQGEDRNKLLDYLIENAFRSELIGIAPYIDVTAIKG